MRSIVKEYQCIKLLAIYRKDSGKIRLGGKGERGILIENLFAIIGKFDKSRSIRSLCTFNFNRKFLDEFQADFSIARNAQGKIIYYFLQFSDYVCIDIYVKEIFVFKLFDSSNFIQKSKIDRIWLFYFAVKIASHPISYTLRCPV